MCTKLSNTIFSLGTNCCPVVCDVASTSEHRRLYWNKSFLFWYLFSLCIIYLKHLVNICIKTPAVPAFPVFGYFFAREFMFQQSIWSSRDYLKNVFSNRVLACSCSLFYLKEKNNQNPYVFDWLQSFMITCEYKFFNWIVSIQMTQLEAQQEL